MSAPPFKVKAVYEYTSPHEDDLHFPAGQIITVTEEEDDDWYSGEYMDNAGVKQEGIFPRNFVEKFEPTAPPRPTRTKKKEPEPEPEPAPAREPSPPIEPQYEKEVDPELEPEPEPEPVYEASAVREPPPPVPKVEVVESPPPPRTVEAVPPPVAPKAAPVPSKPSAPLPISEKPSGSSFRDRIAAFNKPAPPPAPFKPGGLGSGGSSNFIRKPFVAPPPSKNAYIPPPRELIPHKVYRRDEDPEIAAKESENQELAEKAGFARSNGEEGENQPKPTSLRERIALLQKQQMEQASRHADAAQKKDKPKPPVKKRTESHSTVEGGEEDSVPLERRAADDAIRKHSIDSVSEEASSQRKRESSGAPPTIPGVPRKSFGDGNDFDMSGAGEIAEEPEEISTRRDNSDEKPRTRAPQPIARAPTAPAHQPDVGEEEGATEEPEDEEIEDDEAEEDIDPEVRRKEELIARMAKMSGGMGMHGIFGPPGGMPMSIPPAPPKKKKPIRTSEKRSGEYDSGDVPSSNTYAPPVPTVPLPELSRVRSPEESPKQPQHDEREEDNIHFLTSEPADELPDIEEVVPPPVPWQELSSAPPIPVGKPAPPALPKESQPAPQTPVSPSAGSESDDEMSSGARRSSIVTPKSEVPYRPGESQLSPRSPSSKRASYFKDEASPISPTSQGPGNKRLSRVPPIPGTPTVASLLTRAPPPPPPTSTLSRSSTGDHRVPPPLSSVPNEESEEEATEYEGDYDTDIASAVPYRDALKARTTDSNLDDNSLVRSSVISPSTAPPPLPPTHAPRAVPPPLPSQPPPSKTRPSSEIIRSAPPPSSSAPKAKSPAPWEQDDDEYDPYKYTFPVQSPSISTSISFSQTSPRIERNEEDLYSASPPRKYASPPPPPPGSSMQVPVRAAHKQSLDVQRSATSAKRSVELSRMSMDSGFLANEVDLGRSSYWWTQPKGVPPVFANRIDILLEREESSSKIGGKTITTKEVYVLYQDYSQTIISAEFDSQNPGDVNLEQRHEQPPARLRQDQLEQAHERFGRRISEAVTSKKDMVVSDGTPQALVRYLLRPLASALRPIGSRAYGAVVYSNLANASTQQNDEIRPGDIITLRNTKFQGKHGPMHAKYSMEVGKPDHVGIVAEWDGTKKKVRAWEQGRESKKVKLESFKLDDLRSGEVKIWRVMPRSWVGWQGHN